MSPQLRRLKGTITKWLGTATGESRSTATTPKSTRATQQVKADREDRAARLPPQRVHHVDRAS